MDTGYWILDTGYWILDTRYWMLDTRYWMLDAGYWMLDSGCWILDTGCWILDTGCWMLDTGYWILDAGYSDTGYPKKYSPQVEIHDQGSSIQHPVSSIQYPESIFTELLQKIKSILLKDSFKQVGAYTITGSLCKAISFAALPFFINTLQEGDIGILNIFGNSIVFLTPVVSMGVLYTISIDYFKLSKEKYARVFSTGLIIPVVLSLLLLPVLYIFRAPLERSFNFQQDFFWLIPSCLFFNFCFEAFVILMRNQDKVKLFSAVSLLKILLEVGLSIIFIIFIYKTWYSRALAFLIAGALISILFFYHVKKNNFLVRNIDHKVLRNELYFGLSGVVLQTAIFFVGTSDKFFVMSFFGKVQAGYYAVASTFATIQYVVCISLLQYLQPVLFKEFAAMQNWKNLKGVYYKYFLAMFLTLSGVIVFTFVVYNFVLRTAYREYLYYFYILSISSFFWTISNIFLQFIVFNKNRKVIFLLSVISISISLGVNYISSAYFDVKWLGFGQIVTNALVLFIILFLNKRLNYFA